MILDSVRLTTLTVMSVVPSGRVRTGRAQELEWEAGSDLLRATRAALERQLASVLWLLLQCPLLPDYLWSSHA